MQMNGMLEICSVGRNSEPHSPRATYRGHLIYLLRRRRGSPLLVLPRILAQTKTRLRFVTTLTFWMMGGMRELVHSMTLALVEKFDEPPLRRFLVSSEVLQLSWSARQFDDDTPR
ncbi:uncharacterized protein CELE_T28C6.11 [Caenorhabditis elegans]|uniref:Uncharacterized protein n=1 Tax=Caenorhabditis elegans TaxID=6239 RepID=G3MTY6_CAEEL|nr:Uncharacterized protein CELE_T28C6.11 [Caenorhabditis elegans]CCD31126.1 Uncharacterized protein CELE_T28C6.11 [Caenorhabditis elegans]|eukprot:NP_001255340.1 Uncharacterized protein CELE_T28C6.11 [Caenorhabditis elegans]